MDRLDEVVDCFGKDADIEILNPFVDRDKNIIGGKISLTVENERLDFGVQIPEAYPLRNSIDISTIFSCDQIEGYPHHLVNNTICLMPTKTAILSERLSEEIVLLKLWMKKYYIDKESDSHYDYLQFKYGDTRIRTTLLFTEVNKIFKKGDFGGFIYSIIRTSPTIGGINELCAVQYFEYLGIPISCEWSENFRLAFAENQGGGFWFYIENEPISAPYRIAENWTALAPLLSREQITFLYQKVEKLDQAVFYVLIGYNINMGGGKQKVHWQLIKLDKSKFPFKAIKENNTITKFECLTQPIHWSMTKNASYARYFGRGKLSDNITQARILLIGVGAVGSALAVSLARGGARHLAFTDFDIVESGNICRSEYSLLQESFPKCMALEQQLLGISPFLNLESFSIKTGFPKIRPDLSLFEEFRKLISSFDLIFDCSTDMEVAYLLDSMKLTSPVFNLSMTNGAKEFVCITGNTIAEDKANIFSGLDNKEELIFEGQGCAFPTFRASYVDVNMLTNLALKNIDLKLQNNRPNSFVIRTNPNPNSFNLIVDDF